MSDDDSTTRTSENEYNELNSDNEESVAPNQRRIIPETPPRIVANANRQPPHWSRGQLTHGIPRYDTDNLPLFRYNCVEHYIGRKAYERIVEKSDYFPSFNRLLKDIRLLNVLSPWRDPRNHLRQLTVRETVTITDNLSYLFVASTINHPAGGKPIIPTLTVTEITSQPHPLGHIKSLDIPPEVVEPPSEDNPVNID